MLSTLAIGITRVKTVKDTAELKYNTPTRLIDRFRLDEASYKNPLDRAKPPSTAEMTANSNDGDSPLAMLAIVYTI